MAGPSAFDLVLPRPRQIEPAPGSFHPACGCPLAAPGKADIGPLAELCRSCGLSVSPALMQNDALTVTLGAPDSAAAEKCRRAMSELNGRLRDPGPLHEAHVIEIGRTGAIAAANSEEGLFRAATTLAALIAPEGAMPCGSIIDWPALSSRSVLLDLSRGKAASLEWLKNFVDLLALLKFNQLTFNIEHMFASPKHPLIGQGRGAMTQEEMRALDKYARERFVEIIPFQQSLGHLHHLLAIPEYRRLAYDPERLWSIDPSNSDSYQLLADLYDDQIEATSSSLFHIGCDEPFDMRKKWDASRFGGRDLPRIFRDHIIKLHAILRERGRRTMIWADEPVAHPEIIPDLPDDIILCHWLYGTAALEGPKHYQPSLEILSAAKRPFIACTASNSYSKLFPDLAIMEKNHESFIPLAKEYGAQGMMLTIWGDMGHMNLCGLETWPLAIAARHAWEDSPKSGNHDAAYAWTVFRDASGSSAKLARSADRVNSILKGPAAMGGVGLLLLFAEPLQAGLIAQSQPDFSAAAKEIGEAIGRCRDLLASMESRNLRFRSLWLDHHFPLLAAELIARKLETVDLVQKKWPAPNEAAKRCRDAAQLAAGCLALLESRWLAGFKETDLEVNRARFRRLIRAWLDRADQLENSGDINPTSLILHPPTGYTFDVLAEMGLAGLL